MLHHSGWCVPIGVVGPSVDIESFEVVEEVGPLLRCLSAQLLLLGRLLRLYLRLPLALLLPITHLLLHRLHLLVVGTILLSLVRIADFFPNIFVNLSTTVHLSGAAIEELLVRVHLSKIVD